MNDITSQKIYGEIYGEIRRMHGMMRARIKHNIFMPVLNLLALYEREEGGDFGRHRQQSEKSSAHNQKGFYVVCPYIYQIDQIHDSNEDKAELV